MPNKIKRAQVKQFIEHEVVEGKSWQDADAALKLLIQKVLYEFDLWRRGRKNLHLLSIQGPSANFAQLREVSNDMRGVATLQVLYEE